MSTSEPRPKLQPCPHCGKPIDVAGQEPLAEIDCPQCGARVCIECAFDNYNLLELLGTGGMGSVYKAEDTRLKRFVALKLLRPEIAADPESAAQLQHEARRTASINHPHVVKVFSFGSAHGQFYLVMELVEKWSLDELLEVQHRITEAQTLELGIQVARGLQAALAAGLIHRDVKPANILFADPHMAKIVDFGLATAAEHKAEAVGQIWGTPYYVAPERLNNAPEDFRSDIYSLGATLFHAITGRPVFEGDTSSAVELNELKSRPLRLRTVAPTVTGATADTIDRMIQPDPARRHASYDELIGDLQKAENSLSEMQPVAPAQRPRLSFRRFWQRK